MRLISDEALAVVTIWQEAAGESFEGKVAVGEVIRNRMRRFYSSDGTVAGTVARRKQFSGWNDSAQENALLIRSLRLDDGDAVVNSCLTAWRHAQDGSELANGAVLYANLAVCTPPWLPNVQQVAKIGHHNFFDESR